MEAVCHNNAPKVNFVSVTVKTIQLACFDNPIERVQRDQANMEFHKFGF